MTAKRLCCAPDARSVLACDRAAKHKGQHAATVDGERFYWGRASGPSKPHAKRRAAGLTRIDQYVGTEAAAGYERLKARLGSPKAALEWALTQAPEPRT